MISAYIEVCCDKPNCTAHTTIALPAEALSPANVLYRSRLRENGWRSSLEWDGPKGGKHWEHVCPACQPGEQLSLL